MDFLIPYPLMSEIVIVHKRLQSATNLTNLFVKKSLPWGVFKHATRAYLQSFFSIFTRHSL